MKLFIVLAFIMNNLVLIVMTILELISPNYRKVSLAFLSVLPNVFMSVFVKHII